MSYSEHIALMVTCSRRWASVLIHEGAMIKIKLKQLLADKAFQGDKVTLMELASSTGISRSTLNRIANIPSYSTTTDHLNKICVALNCRLDELAEFVPEKNVE